MFIEDADRILVALRVAEPGQPVGEYVLWQHNPGDVPYDFRAEGDGADSHGLVGLHCQDVVIRRYPQRLQFRPGPFLDDDLLDVGRYAIPQLAVDDIGGVAESDYRPGHVIGYLVIPAANGQQGPGGANVNRAVLQREVICARGNEQGLGAHPLDEAAQGGGVRADFLSFEILQRADGFLAEEPLVGAGEPVPVHHHAAGFVHQHPLDVRHHVHQRQVGGLPVRPHAPEGLHFDGGQFAGHVAGIDVGHVQGAGSHLAQGVFAADAQLEQGGDRQLDLAVGAGGQPGGVVSLHDDAEGQVAGNADVLNLDVFAGGGQLSRVDQVGLFNQPAVVVAGVDELVARNAKLRHSEHPDLENLLELRFLLVSGRQEHQAFMGRRADELGEAGRIGRVANEDGSRAVGVFRGVFRQHVLCGHRGRRGGLRRRGGRNGRRLRDLRSDDCRGRCRGRNRRCRRLRRGRRRRRIGGWRSRSIRGRCRNIRGSRSSRWGGIVPAAGCQRSNQDQNQHHRNNQSCHIRSCLAERPAAALRDAAF